MAKWDKDYLDLCKRILTEGKETENRTGINTIKIPSHHFHFNLEEEFPILVLLCGEVFLVDSLIPCGKFQYVVFKPVYCHFGSIVQFHDFSILS